jgi:Spy/CpxP family protein refolding chaperone
VIRTKRLLFAAALATTLAFGQGPRPRGEGGDPTQMRVDMLTRMLDLTDEQKAKATTIYTEAHSASRTARTSMQNTMESMDEAVKANNTASIDQLAITAGTLSGQLMAVQRKADAAFYQILTAEQKEKFDNMPRGFGGGPGPFGGRRGPANR